MLKNCFQNSKKLKIFKAENLRNYIWYRLALKTGMCHKNIKMQNISSSMLCELFTVWIFSILQYNVRQTILSHCNIFVTQGFDVWTKISQICLYTADRDLRDYLAGELKQESCLSEHEQAMLGFVHQLERLYSCPSFDLAKVLRTEGQTK